MGGSMFLSRRDVPSDIAFDAIDAEIRTCAIDGEGTVATGDAAAPSETGVGITLMTGSTATITATRPMQLFAAWLTVEGPV